MSTLKERIAQCLEKTPLTAARLARECKVSRTAAGKWINGDTKKLDIDVVFELAKVLHVDPEWLALGTGKPDRGAAQVRSDAKEIPERQIGLLKAFGSLHESVRLQLEILIHTLVAASSDRHAEHTKNIDAFNHKRDTTKAKKAAPEKPS